MSILYPISFDLSTTNRTRSFGGLSSIRDDALWQIFGALAFWLDRCFARDRKFYARYKSRPNNDDDCKTVHINCCNVIFGPIVFWPAPRPSPPSKYPAPPHIRWNRPIKGAFSMCSRRLCVTWQFSQKGIPTMQTFSLQQIITVKKKKQKVQLHYTFLFFFLLLCSA